jgi:hypothetical protein
MRARLCLIPALLLSLVIAAPRAQQATPAKGAASITESDLKEWLTYIASDELQGRATYSEGLGLAAGYISSHLRQWGVKPAGDKGTYLQVVKVLGVKTNSKASVTVDVNGQSRTFKDGEGITFPKEMGGKQTIAGDQIAFVGYGLQLPSADIDDYRGIDPKGKVVVYLGLQGPANLPPGSGRTLSSRARAARDKGAVATIGPAAVPAAGRGTPAVTPAPPPAPPAGRGRGQAQPDNGDFTTVQRYDAPVTPQLTVQDDFFEFLFSGSEIKYADLKARADKREPLPADVLKGVRMTINVDADYQVVRTRLTHNVVGIVEGSDPKLKDTYVAFGAHYDHVGYSEFPSIRTQGGTPNPGGCTGQVRPTPAAGDLINNGADDDGSGTVALMALAKAFATGPKTKRSVLFVWHAGEENGLLGSEYMADHPVVPLESIVSQLNIDMIGRNRCDDPAAANMVLVVGSDRISTELHNINEEANASLAKPLALDYQMNDPQDPESIYTRSDHYSYASKGIPIIFFFTGLHKDYHFVTDEISKIEFPKMTRIAQLVYTTGMKVANSDKAPARDNKGPRMGKGSSGKLPVGK